MKMGISYNLTALSSLLQELKQTSRDDKSIVGGPAYEHFIAKLFNILIKEIRGVFYALVQFNLRNFLDFAFGILEQAC